jgi:hypothetical protein
VEVGLVVGQGSAAVRVGVLAGLAVRAEFVALVVVSEPGLSPRRRPRLGVLLRLPPPARVLVLWGCR